MKYIGTVKKMQTDHAVPVRYTLNIGNDNVLMNSIIGQDISIKYTGNIYCMECGVKTIKSFSQGYCYPCFTKVPYTAPCIIHPELCEAHLGKARDMKWSEENCLQPHIVYLAVSSNLKVGVTRKTQIPTRWIDQGATKAIELCETPDRHTAGVIEVFLKQYLSDKTSWQKMLKNEIVKDVDLLQEKDNTADLLNDEFKYYISDNDEITKINYPVEQYPIKVKSINLDKIAQYEGKLVGIKGQYLIFEDGSVINIRKYGGYELEISF